MSRITLVTGATGFIGSHLVEQLLDRGEEVRVLVRDPAKLEAVGLAGRKGLSVARGDLLEPASIKSAVAGVSRVYHVAGFISTARRDRDKLHRINHEGTATLLSALERTAVDKVVYLASIFALGGPNSPKDTRWVREDTSYNLGGMDIDYFHAKRQAELYAYDCRDRGLPLVFVYPCFCYGPGDIYISSSRLVLDFLRRKLPAYVNGGHNAMDVRDAATGLILGMDQGKIGSKYIVGGANVSYRELLAMLAQLTNLPVPRLRLPRMAAILAGRLAELLHQAPPIDEQSGRMLGYHWYYDDSKARRELGYDPRPLSVGLWDAIQWFCEQGMAPRPPAMRRAA